MIDSFVDPDISVPTAVEIAIFIRDHAMDTCGLRTHTDIAESVVSHAENDMIYWSRGDNGELRAVMFGWPVSQADLDADTVATALAPMGEILYVNLMVVAKNESKRDSIEAVRSMKDMVDARHGGRVKKLAYHKGKIGDKFLIIPLV
jgi:hypothetical protein